MNPVDHPHGGGEGKTSEEEVQYHLGAICERTKNTKTKKK